MTKFATSYLIALPVLWSVGSLIHFHFPGDEYGLWVLGSIAGSWVAFFVPNIGDIHHWTLRGAVVGTGAVTMLGLGALLYWLRVPGRAWIAAWLVSALAIFILVLGRFSSSAQALAANGSWTAYILFAGLAGATLTSVLSIIAAGIATGWRPRRGLRPDRVPPLNGRDGLSDSAGTP